MVCEVMGRHTGWIAVMAGMAGGADVILIPELPMTVEHCCELIRTATPEARTSRSSSSARATSCTTSAASRAASRRPTSTRSATPGWAASAPRSRRRSSERTGFETRVTTLGHIQRGGSPTARDRVLATRYGLKAAELVREGAGA